jgi:beta-hydroxylase
VNGDAYDNALQRDKKNKQRDTSSIVKGEVYHWHEGEGIVFDDNYLHDAANTSDQVRVVLWLDLKRPLPLPLDLFNRLVGWVVYRDPALRRLRREAVVRD